MIMQVANWDINRKYCSKVCTNLSQMVDQIDKLCEWCGKLYQIRKTEIDKRKYCSKNCVNQSKRGITTWNAGLTYDKMYGDRKEEILQKFRNSMCGQRRTAHTKKLQSLAAIRAYKNGKVRLIGDANPAKRLDVRKKISIGLHKAIREGRYPIKYGDDNPARRPEVRLKHRLRRLKEISESTFYGYQVIPSYNKRSISILESKATELEITDLQHAENSGEYHIKELGYFVDGYSKEKNIVIEYYENAHKNKIERDARRKQEIVDFLGCEFIELKEWIN